MAKQEKIVVNLKQSIAVREYLKANWETKPVEDQITELAEAAEIKTEWAERFVLSWKHNHEQSTNTDAADKTTSKAPAEEYFIRTPMPGPKAEQGTGIVAQIIALAKEGKSVAEIIAMGYNKSTVYRQVGEWRKRVKEGTDTKHNESNTGTDSEEVDPHAGAKLFIHEALQG